MSSLGCRATHLLALLPPCPPFRSLLLAAPPLPQLLQLLMRLVQLEQQLLQVGRSKPGGSCGTKVTQKVNRVYPTEAGAADVASTADPMAFKAGRQAGGPIIIALALHVRSLLAASCSVTQPHRFSRALALPVALLR